MSDILAEIQWMDIIKMPLAALGLVILSSLLVTLILYLKGYSAEGIAKFWLKVLMIIFRYKEKQDGKRTN